MNQGLLPLILGVDNQIEKPIEVKHTSTLLCNWQILNLFGSSDHSLLNKCCILDLSSVFRIINSRQCQCNRSCDDGCGDAGARIHDALICILYAKAHYLGASRDQIWLHVSHSLYQIPCSHSSRRKSSDVREALVQRAYPQHINQVTRIVQRSLKGSLVADSRHDYYSVCS